MMKPKNKQVDKKDIEQIRREVQIGVSGELVAVREQLEQLQHALDRITVYFIDGDAEVGVIPFVKQIESNRDRIGEIERILRENDIVERINIMYEAYRDLKGTVRVSSVSWGFLTAMITTVFALVAWIIGNKT